MVLNPPSHSPYLQHLASRKIRRAWVRACCVYTARSLQDSPRCSRRAWRHGATYLRARCYHGQPERVAADLVIGPFRQHFMVINSGREKGRTSLVECEVWLPWKLHGSQPQFFLVWILVSCPSVRLILGATLDPSGDRPATLSDSQRTRSSGDCPDAAQLKMNCSVETDHPRRRTK
jgi:hypothetical protein